MGKELDLRSDVYALALVTYEMATGKAPFANAASLYDVMQCHCDPDKLPEPIATKNLELRLPGRLDLIIRTAMQTNPDRRFQSVKLFEDALKVWYDAVQKGMTQEEVDLIPVESGAAPIAAVQEVETSKSIDSLPALVQRSQSAAWPPSAADGASATSTGALAGSNFVKSAGADAVARAGSPKSEVSEAGAAGGLAGALGMGTGPGTAPSAAAAQSVPLEVDTPKTAWRIPEMVTTHHGGGWGVVSGQELNFIRQSEPMIGRLLNNQYRVQEMIGEGGMSVVYRAEDTQNGKMVAVKSLKFVDAELAERFSREINLHMELKHPNIVKAIERISTVNQTFFVMELLSGTVLEDYLEREFCVSPFNDICTILAQICDALEFAHDQDVIHRDLKPGNVMLVDQAGALRIKVLDFGLAQIQADLQRMTRTGILVGSPAYMSPEHCLGSPLTCQSDIYSLGVLAFEIIAGELPFEGDTDIGIVKAHCDMNLEAFPISKFRQDLPAIEELEKVLARALAKDQSVRYGAIEDFRRGLNDWWIAAGRTAEESPFKERRRRRKRVRSVTGIPAAAAEREAVAAVNKTSGEDLNSLVDKHRQAQAETVTSKWRDDSRFDGQRQGQIKMVVITILIFCIMGTIVWFSMQSKPAPRPVVVEPKAEIVSPEPGETSQPGDTVRPGDVDAVGEPLEAPYEPPQNSSTMEEPPRKKRGFKIYAPGRVR